MTFADMRRAVRHFPSHLPSASHNRRAWLRSIAYLRQRNLWVLEGGAAKFHSAAQ